MIKKRLLVDMDGTLARFHDQAMYLERMYEKNFFLDLVPFQNMVDAVRYIVQHHPEVEVYIVSAKVIGEPPYCVDEKNAWLDRYLPEIDADHRIFTDIGHSKAEYMPGGVTRDDFLMDDYNKGLNMFLADGGSAIKVMNNINMRGLGAYGGDKGVMWTGPLVTTEANPITIVGDILECMGMPRDKHAELAALDMVGFPDSNSNHTKINCIYLKNSDLPPIHISNNPRSYIPFSCASFGDAVKYLDAHRRCSVRELSAFAGKLIPMSDPKKQHENIMIPNWQLEAICTNFKLSSRDLLSGIDMVTMHSIKKELACSTQPVYGKMDFILQDPDSSNPVEKREIFHDPVDLHDSYQRCKESPYTSGVHVEWFADPNEEQQRKILESDLNLNTESWEMTDDACLQHRRTLDPLGANDSFELCQIQELPNGEYGICHGSLFELSKRPEKEIEEYLNLYGFADLEDYVRQGSASCEFIYDANGNIDRENSPSWIIDYGFIAEMIFETEYMDYLDDSRTYSWDEAVSEIARITGDPHVLEHKNNPVSSLEEMVQDARTRNLNPESGQSRAIHRD